MSRHAGSVTTDPDRPLAWFRFEAEFATDPRIAGLSDRAIAAYLFALCATARRIAPCSDEAMAWFARRKPSHIVECKRQLMAAGLINDEWVPTDWPERQPPTDATNAQRQARHRERLKAARLDADETEPNSSQSSRDGAATEPRPAAAEPRPAAEASNRNAADPQIPPNSAETATSNGVTNALLTAPQDRTGQDRTDRTEQTGQDRRGIRTSAATESAERKSLCTNRIHPFGPLSPEVNHERQSQDARLRGDQ